MKIAIGLLIVLMLSTLSITSAVAQEELPDPGITPDSWLYGLDRAIESLQKIFTFAPEAKARLALQLAAERLAEAKAMAEARKPELAVGVASDYEAELKEAETYGTAIADLARKKDFEALVAKATSVHIDVLERVLEKLPDTAKPGMRHALERSKRGHDETLNRLGEIAPEEAAMLRFEYAEKRLNKAREKAREGNVEEAEALVKEYKEEMNNSSEMRKRAEGIGRNVTRLVELVANRTSKHLQVLQEIYEKVPDQAKPAIEKAMNVSAKGQESALTALQRVKPEIAEEIERNMPEDVQDIRKHIGRPETVTSRTTTTTTLLTTTTTIPRRQPPV